MPALAATSTVISDIQPPGAIGTKKPKKPGESIKYLRSGFGPRTTEGGGRYLEIALTPSSPTDLLGCLFRRINLIIGSRVTRFSFLILRVFDKLFDQCHSLSFNGFGTDFRVIFSLI